MTQRKIISIIGTLIGIFSVFMVVVWCRLPRLQNVAGLIVMSEDMSCYLVDNTADSPIIYEVDTEGSIVRFLHTASREERQDIINIIWDGEGLSYLKQIHDSEGQIFYELFVCDARLEQEIKQGILTLENGERPIQLTKGTEYWELVAMDEEHSKIKVYQISGKRQSEHNSLTLELLQEVEAGEQEWVCDATYSEDRVYILNQYGRVKCYVQGEREKIKKLYRRKITELTESRAGLCCQLRKGKLELLADSTFIKWEAIENLWAIDAMSAKANVQLGRRETGEKYLVFYHSGEKEEVSSLKFSWRLWIPFCRSILFRTICALVLTYTVFILIWFYLRKSREKRTLTAVVISQIGLGIILCCGMAVGREFLLSVEQEKAGQIWAQSIAKQLEELDFYTMNLRELAKKGFFERLQTALKTRVFKVDNQWVEQSITVVSAGVSEKTVVLAAGEYACGRQVDVDIPWEILQMIEETRTSGQIETRAMCSKFAVFSGEKQNTVWSVLPAGERVVPSIFFISKLEIKEQDNMVWLYFVIGWMAMELLLSVTVTILQRNSIYRFVKAVEASIEGTRNKSPVQWRGVFALAWVEIQKQITRLECMRNQQSEDQKKYERFISKDFAQLLGQDDIQDLRAGEHCEVTGTFFHVLVGEPEKLLQKNSTFIQQVNELLEFFSRKSAASKRVIFSEASTPGKFCIVYKEQAKEALQDAIEMCQYLNDNNKIEEQMPIAFLLHYHTCLCGLTGSTTEIFPFVYTQEIKILEKCTKFLQQAQVRLTVTEELLPYLNQGERYRYIGFVNGATEGKLFRFYEILEVYPENEKQKRTAAAEKFSQALELFYENDFYLARLQFMEIIKECPEDHLARHHLFACERMFQAQNSQEISHQLVEII